MILLMAEDNNRSKGKENKWISDRVREVHGEEAQKHLGGNLYGLYSKSI